MEIRELNPIEGPKGRLGRLQRGVLRCFTVQNGEAQSSELQSWCTKPYVKKLRPA
jgi:hypothetical protein